MGQARQSAADDGAADPEDLAQGLLAQLGPGCQALLENGLEDMGVHDIVLSPAAAGLAGARLLLEGLQLFVHGCSRQRGSAVTEPRLLPPGPTGKQGGGRTL